MSDLTEQASIAGQLLLHVAVLSLMTVGGGVTALLPEMQRYVVDAHNWMGNNEFVASFTIAQVAPGPNLLYFTLLGLQAAGLLGALAATLAITLPPAMVCLGAVHMSRNKTLAGVGRIVKAALQPISVGMMLATGWALARAADSDWQGALLTIATVALVLRFNMNPLWLIAAGAVTGIAIGGV